MIALDGLADSPDRICTACGRTTPEVHFKAKGSRNPDRYHSMCNSCLYLRYTKPWADKQTAELRAYKMEKGCTDCGYAAHPAALEFDHLPGTIKLFNVGEQAGNRSMEALWAEVSKCEVVCANCHAIRTATRRAQQDASMITA